MKSSASDFGRDHGLIHEAVVTGRKAGWTVDDWAKLAHSEEKMRDIRKVLLGHAEVVSKPVIDCDADPLVPEGWEVVAHRRGGHFKWDKDAQRDTLYLSKEQKNCKRIEGNKLREEMWNKPVLNANVLDHLLANPHLIPEEWKEEKVSFWGTIYHDIIGDLLVRHLFWDGGGWNSGPLWLDDGRHANSPAAISAH